MNIIEATQQALETNKGFARKDQALHKAGYYMIPNGNSYSMHRFNKEETERKKLWNPNADDILANDYVLVNIKDR